MTTTNKQISSSAFTAAYSTSGTIDVSCNNMEWYAAISATAPAATLAGRLLMPNKVYNIELTGSEKLYAKTQSGTAILAIDV